MAAKKQFSTTQRQVLLDFIESNPEMVKQRFSNQYTSADIRNNWKEISSKLNAIPGVQKSWKEWRKSWSDIKSRTKKKHAEIHRSMRETGGGPSTSVQLDTTEDRILDMIGGEMLVKGNNEITEAGISEEIMNKQRVSKTNDYELLQTDTIASWDHQYLEIQLPSENQNNSDNAYSRQIYENEQTENSNMYKNSVSNKVRPPLREKIIPANNRKNLKASIEASTTFIQIGQEKNAIRQKYYEEKILIMERKIAIKERIATALEKLAKSVATSNGKV